MTLSYKTHAATATTGDVNGHPLGYSFSFPSLSEDDITVTVGGSPKSKPTDYTIINWTEDAGLNPYIKFATQDARGTGIIRISRGTTSSGPEHDFQAGSAIKAADLNTCNKQNIYLAQENRDSLNALALGDASSAIQINSANIANLTIQAEDIKSGAVETDKINNLAVTTRKIADDAVTTDKLANSINTTIAGKANTGANLSTFTNDTNYITLAQAFTTGMIMMFTGSTAPNGWAICDGQNGTPDLRARFIVGAGDGTGAGNSNYSIGDNSGAEQVTLLEGQMPQHSHTFSGSNTHKHNFTGAAANDHNDSQRNAIVAKNDIQQSYMIFTSSSNTGVQDTTITISGNTGDKGSGSSHENRPPYYALSYIMKL